MQVLVTGAAGFIGFHLCKRLLQEGHPVVGLDNLNNYYDPNLKTARLKELYELPGFDFVKLDLQDRINIQALFQSYHFDRVVHLAAQAGVRYSIENPYSYVDSNLVGFINILEACRQQATPHLVFASSSSVYGNSSLTPFSEAHNVDHPISLYAATKKANELMAHTYAHLYGLPCTGLRFFTVYGPWGRPDMAPFKFTKNIIEDHPIEIYNHGKMLRDFTYIDDIIESLVRVIDLIPQTELEASSSKAPYCIYNIGNNHPVALMDFITALETAIGKTAQKHYLDMQPGDVVATYADTSRLEAATGFKPSTTIQEGVKRLVKWYRHYYQA